MKNQVAAEKVDFEWIISKRVIGEYLTAYFNCGEWKWCVSLYSPGVPYKFDNEFVTIAISLDKSRSNMLASPKVRIINHLFPTKTVNRQINLFAFRSNRFGFPSKKCEFSDIHICELLNESNGFLDGDKLKITIQLNVEAESAAYPISSSLILNQKKLFDLGEYCDCVLVCPDGEVKAMKFLLASQSDVFRTMFQGDMKEAQVGRVEISDIRVNVISAFIEFTLSGSVENLTEIVEELFMAADKYNVVDLRNLCILELCETITSKNLCKRFIIADRYQVHCLTTELNDFILHNDCYLSIEKYEKLLLTAEEYGIKNLKDTCSRAIANTLSKDNVCGRLALVDRFGLNSFVRERAISFISENCQSED